jgi:hypothetical protein
MIPAVRSDDLRAVGVSWEAGAGGTIFQIANYFCEEELSTGARYGLLGVSIV